MIFLIIFLIAWAAIVFGLSFISINPLLMVVWVVLGLGLNLLLLAIVLYFIILPILGLVNSKNKFKAWVCHQMMFLIMTIMRTSYSVKNKENILKANGKPLVIVANHKCTLDVIWVYLAMRQPMTGVAKDSLGKNKFYKPIIKAFDVILLNRESDREAAKSIIKGSKMIKDGLPVLIFTEGGIRTRETEQMVCVRPGAYKLATKAEAAIQPIVIRNSHTMSKRKWYNWTHVTMEVLPVVEHDDYKEMNTTELGLDIAAKINSNFNEPQVDVEVILKL